ncbi:hypothetical protein TARUN_4201 [Trichoderma arundinaceum]|uniref:Uncharacterized protein n=1 Tax=Trichoderma arundinaceum TaxID=490622 RepID=A0A395NPY3_TRIAR|nr:hypothetical protein TARUN_4201 [Trichoderma arundinaceum]
MPIRNPFARRPGAVVSADENVFTDQEHHYPGFERVDTVGSKASSVLSIRSARSQDTGEYKMSVVNDSGIYLPPSPSEEKGHWPRRYLSSRESSDSSGEIEQFSISRESFDSYRRSFDISARSPISAYDVPARQSLDSARFARLPRSAINRNMEQLPTAEENFEDVGLDDQKQQPRKRGFFSKLTETQEKDASAQTGVSRFLMPGRKRAQSGQGAELGTMEQTTVTSTD